MSDSEQTIDRRKFLTTSAALLAGSAAFPSTALSYDRILGANDRISLCHIGNGSRGGDLAWIVSQLKTSQNAEINTVCDLWRLNREKAVAVNTKYYGRAPRSYQYVDDVLALKDVDAVIISTPEHSHSPILKMAVEAGKDAYVEKPMGNVLAEAKAARDATMKSKRIVQVGTQHRSEPYPRAAHELVQTGVLGEVSKVEIVWNYHGPRWRGREETKLSAGTGYGLAKMAAHQARSSLRSQSLLRIPLVQGILQRHSGSMDEPRNRHRALVHERQLSPLRSRSWRHFCLARWPGESRYVSSLAGISQGFSAELLNQLRQRFPKLHTLHGEKINADEHWRRRQPAIPIGRRERES